MVNLKTRNKLFTENIILVLFSIFIAVSLSEGENSIFDIRLMYSPDQINHFKLAQSSEIQLLDLRFPIRTAENIDDVPGNPIHQFYSPAVHFFMAVFSIIFLDLIYGTSILFVLMMALGFIYSYKIYKYLTQSPVYAYAGAFLFAGCPYLSSLRLTHGAISEYFGFCLAPAVVFYLLRSMAGKNFLNIFLCILSLSILILIHLITTFYLMFFISFFYFIYFINIFIQYKFNKLNNLQKHLKVFFRRLSIFIVINIFSIAITCYYIIPIITSNDLFIKYFPYSQYLRYSASCTALLSLFSIKPSLNIINIHFCRGSYQIGFITFIGVVFSSLILWKKKKSLFIIPLIFTILLILFIIINPVILTYFPYLNLAQFTTRFLLDFQIIASILFVLGMKELCTIIHFTNLNKIIFSILVIVSSLLMSIQFLSPMNIQEDFPIRMNSNDIKNEPYNPFSKYAYYQILKDTAKFSSLTNKFIIEPASTSNSQHNKFIIDLSILSQNNDYNGNVIFYVLYYPSLMKVTAKLDGTVFTPETDTFWFKTPELSEAQQYRYLGIHTLQLKNLPAQGILEVDTEFIGSALGNKISLISIFLLAGLGLIKLIRCRRQGAGQRPAPKGPELSPEPEKLL